MAIYLKKFEDHILYETYINDSSAILPNVSVCTTEGDVHYNPYVPHQDNNIIIYAANAKLPETTSNKTSGLHTNAFNTTIKSHTFENGVGTIEFNDDVTTVGNYAFYGSTHTSISIPDSVTSIGSYTFQSCSGLTSCTIGSGVTSIGNFVFQGCTSLTSITSNATTAPTISSSTFRDVKSGGTLTVPIGNTGYNVWMSTGNYYLGLYNWTKVEQ